MNQLTVLFQINNSLLFSMILLIGSTIMSCSTKQKAVEQATTTAVVITYEKERSRGNKLPLYSIEILENKTVRYTGKANVSYIGERIFELQSTQYESIIKKIEAVAFKSLDSVYKGNKRDLPLTSITYNGQKVTYQEEACPEKLKALADLLEEVIVE